MLLLYVTGITTKLRRSSDLTRASLLIYPILALSFVLILYPRSSSVTPAVEPRTPAKAAESVAQKHRTLPIAFIENRGILRGPFKYFANGPGYTFYLSREGATYALYADDRRRAPGVGKRPQANSSAYALKIKFSGAASGDLSGRDRQEARFNYFKGNDRKRWVSGVRSYGQVALNDLYKGVDLAYKSDRRGIKYEFTVAPGADHRAIRLDYEGADSLRVDKKGVLRINTPVGQVRDSRPFIYQDLNGRRAEIKGGYIVKGRSVGFWIGKYKKHLPLIIDPGLSYSTFIGGGNLDYGVDVLSLDASGCAYVTGYTYSLNFPTSAGAFETSASGGSDVYVAKLNSSGTALVYSTLLGGAGNDFGQSLTLDNDGNVYVAGNTLSADFPNTPGAFDTMANGIDDAFVAKLDPNGASLAYSTFLGGGGADYARGLSVDTSGNAYVGGYTDSPDFPTTAGAFDTGYNGNVDVFVSKINPAGAALSYSTLIGGGGADYAYDLTLDSSGSAYLTGNSASPTWPTTGGVYDNTYNGAGDVYAVKMRPDGAALSYSTFIGGTDSDYGAALALDGLKNVYLAGRTASANFPTSANAYDQSINGGYDGFAAKLDSMGATLTYSSFLGGGGDDYANDISLDSSAAAYLTGYTYSGDFPATPASFDRIHNGGVDAFVSKFDIATGALTYSSFFGGTRNDFGYGLALDAARDLYLAGSSNSTDLPVSASAFDPVNSGLDAYVAKLDIIAPTTMIETSPTAPDGENGWFATAPTVALSADESAAVFFQWETTSGPWTTYSAPVLAVDGDRLFYYRSADLAANTETVSVRSFPVDTNGPTPPVLTGISTTSTAVTLSWSGAIDTVSGLDRYRVYEAAGSSVLDETAATTYIHGGLVPLTPYAYYVKAFDRAGHASIPSSIITVMTTATPTPPTPATGANSIYFAALALLATGLGAAMLSFGRRQNTDTTCKGC